MASLLHPDPCNPVIDWVDSAIRLGDRSHPVARRNSGITVNTDFNMPLLYIPLDTSIKRGLPGLPYFFSRIESLKELTPWAKTPVLAQGVNSLSDSILLKK